MQTIAFLGTGTMGFPMARNLARAGFHVRAWNRSRERAEPLSQAGATIWADAREAAEGADLVVTMMSDAAVVLDTAQYALPATHGEAVWVQMSTIGLEGTGGCIDVAEGLGIPFVDAPVLGTRAPAEAGKLVILASGDGSALERCAGAFASLGRTQRIGAAGSGTRAKLVLNSWVLGVTGLVAETITLAEALGVDPEQFFDALQGGALDLPYARLKGGAMITEAFDNVDFRLSLARKDSDLVLAAAEDAELEIPVLRAVAERLHLAEADGHGERDMAATYLATAQNQTRRRITTRHAR